MKDFKDFYKNSFKKSFRFIYARVVSKEDTEDILSESYFGLYRMWGKLTNENHNSYFFRILKNNLNDFLKQKYEIEFTPLEETDMYDFFDSNEGVGTESSNYNIFRKHLESLVSQLSKKDINFYNLKYKSNMTYRQISDSLGITINNAKVQNNRLIKKIIALYNIQNGK